MSKILTPDSDLKATPRTLALAEGVTAHILLQYDPLKGVHVSYEGGMPTPLLYFHLQVLQERLMAGALMAEQAQAQREAATRVQPARSLREGDSMTGEQFKAVDDCLVCESTLALMGELDRPQAVKIIQICHYSFQREELLAAAVASMHEQYKPYAESLLADAKAAQEQGDLPVADWPDLLRRHIQSAATR